MEARARKGAAARALGGAVALRDRHTTRLYSPVMLRVCKHLFMVQMDRVRNDLHFLLCLFFGQLLRRVDRADFRGLLRSDGRCQALRVRLLFHNLLLLVCNKELGLLGLHQLIVLLN